MNPRPALVASVFFATIVALAQPAHSNARASLGDRIEIADGVMIQPMAVIEDSRCPVHVSCVWAGRLVLRADVYAADQALPLKLTLGVPASVPGGTVTLAKVSPKRDLQSNTNLRRAYKFTFSYVPTASTV